MSIDGVIAETHDWVRGVEGSWERACQAVRNLAAAELRPQVIMSLMRCNADQVDAMIRLAEELGAASLKFNVVQPTGRGEAIQEGADGLEVPELIEIGRHVDMDLAPETELRLVYDYPMAFRPLSRIGSGQSCGVCGILGILGVLPTGHYALCGIGEHIPELVFGQAGRDPLERVWRENPLLNELREGLPERLGGLCERCLVKYRCLGSCVAQNYYRAGTLWAPFWFCEQAETLGLFPESRLVPAEAGAARSMPSGAG